MSNMFRPHSEPAATLYDALIREAEKRKSKPVMDWIRDERLCVWSTARDYAQQHGKAVPTIEAVQLAEDSACGHTDYAAKWAIGVAELLR